MQSLPQDAANLDCEPLVGKRRSAVCYHLGSGWQTARVISQSALHGKERRYAVSLSYACRLKASSVRSTGTATLRFCLISRTIDPVFQFVF